MSKRGEKQKRKVYEKQFREGMIKRDEKRPEKGKDLTNKKCKKGEARVGREREER